MLSKLRSHLKRHPGVSAAPCRLVESEAVQLSLFDEHLADAARTLALIVCHNPLLADHRRQKREALLTTEEALAGIARQVAMSATEIAEKVGRVKNRYQVAKHFQTGLQTDPSTRRQEAITREAQLDGFYVHGADRSTERSASSVTASWKSCRPVCRRLSFILTGWFSVPIMTPLPVKADGGIDTDQVTAITVIEIVDYH